MRLAFNPFLQAAAAAAKRRTVDAAARVHEGLRSNAQLVAVARVVARCDAVKLRQRRVRKLGRLGVRVESSR